MPGEYFRPRDVVHLMVDLMLAGNEAEICAKKAIRTVYDPCCGSGGMLIVTRTRSLTEAPSPPSRRRRLRRHRERPAGKRRQVMLHLARVVRNGLDGRAGCIDPKTQIMEGKACASSAATQPGASVSEVEADGSDAGGDFFVRSGPGTVKASFRQRPGVHLHAVRRRVEAPRYTVAGGWLATAGGGASHTPPPPTPLA
ncbi:MAG TPA: SAM-dependent DNA methyltransferase [Candidatus Latescibacteria bacterium]|nr:SAM-dependent DNA methyltransferase [Candidatus Latescibacterota bacterium]